jgi:hypothetical protein
MKIGKYLLIVVVLLVAVFLFYIGAGGPAFEFIDWFLLQAKTFTAAVWRFITWLFP